MPNVEHTEIEWPAYGLASDVRPLLRDALDRDDPAVLVTLVEAEGAAPLGVGAQMLFAGGRRAGFLSGGCVEGDVALHADAVLADGEPRRLVYGRGGPPDIQLLCGSRIDLLMERLDPETAARLVALGAARRPALWLSDGERRAVLTEGEDGDLPGGLREALDLASLNTAPAGLTAAGGAYRRYDPPARLAVIGADPTSLAVARLAVDMGLEVALIRPKGPERGPPVTGVRYLRESPAESLASLKLDPWTAVAALTHDIDLDHQALAAALPSPALYVGALGSRRRIPERLARLRADGVPEEAIARLKAPIGLEIGARSPYEIAVSVLAEIVAAFRAQESARRWTAASLSEAAP